LNLLQVHWSNKYLPKSNATRAETAAVIQKIIENILN